MRSDPLQSRAGKLATDGRWSELYELLRERPAEATASDPALAYRFGEALYHTGRMEELAAYATVCESVTRRGADPVGTMRALNLAGIAAFELGETAKAREKFDALMELAEAERDEEMLARAANNLGAISNLRGRRHEALAYYHLAIPLYQKMGQPKGLAQTHHNLGMSYRDLGRLEDSAAAYGHAVALAGGIGYRPLVAMSTVGRAEAELLRGDLPLARQLVERGLALARAVPDPISEAEALRVRGLVQAGESAAVAAEVREPGAGAAGAVEAALADLEGAAELARTTRNALLEAEVERDIGRLELRRGRRDEGRRRLEAAASRLDALGAVAEARALREEAEAA